MRHIKGQPLASTNFDRQGERLTKAFLEELAQRTKGKRLPLHQQHDMSKPVPGFMENVRLEPDPENLGEWRLVADVTFDDGKIEDVIGGFSISGVEMLHRSPSASALVYLPYPHYNDEKLVKLLTAEPDLNVGKWIKKGAEPVGWVVLGSVIAFVLSPIWDDVYKRQIAPRIDNLLSKYLAVFHARGLGAELVQIVSFCGRDVEVRLIPIRGAEESCLRSDSVEKGLARMLAVLSADAKAKTVGVDRVVLFFNATIEGFSVHRIEYADGTVIHAA